MRYGRDEQLNKEETFNSSQKVDLNNLMKRVYEQADKISSKPMETLKIGKKAFYKQKEMLLEEAYRYTSKVMTENMLEKDSKEGISAFLEKRFPNWKD